MNEALHLEGLGVGVVGCLRGLISRSGFVA